MATFWQSLGSPTAFQTYFNTYYNTLVTTGQLPVNDWNCSFANPDWSTCLVTSW